MKKFDYLSAEKFILSRELFGMKLGLENITQFLENIGQPQDKFKSVHIAGTNGKGSTAAMLSSIFTAQGYKTGLYTSPHLVDFRERIKTNDTKISKAFVASFIQKHHNEIRRRKLTFFEVVTALALDYFAHAKVVVAVIETGLGGRLDATNVLNPNLTITTDIDFDHTEVLGNTIRKISKEKAGIIKPGRPHLIGMLSNESKKIFEQQTNRLDSQLFELSEKDFKTNPNSMSLGFEDAGLNLTQVKPVLYGNHQLENTALVLKAASIFRQNGLYVSKSAIRNGIKYTNWPGRFQVLSNIGRPTIVLDVAHNSGGVSAFVEAFKLKFPDKKASVISGFVKKKNHQSIFDLLSKVTRDYCLVPLDTKRTMTPNDLIETIDFKGLPVTKAGSVATAFGRLTNKAAVDDIICVVGSHYLVGEFLFKFGEKWAKQPDRKQIQPKPKVRPNRPKKLRIRY